MQSNLLKRLEFVQREDGIWEARLWHDSHQAADPPTATFSTESYPALLWKVKSYIHGVQLAAEAVLRQQERDLLSQVQPQLSSAWLESWNELWGTEEETSSDDSS